MGQVEQATKQSAALARSRLLADFVAEVVDKRSEVRGWTSATSPVLPLAPLGAATWMERS